MKVLHISTESSWRGGEQQIAYLMQESRKAGIDVSVALRKDSAFQDWANQERFPFRAFSFSGLTWILTSWKLKAWAEKFDLVHIHSGKGHDVMAVAAFLGNGTPSVLSRRVDFPIKKGPWAHWKYNLPHFKRILCVSDAIRDIIRPALQHPELAITVHSGVDMERFTGRQSKGKLRKELGIETGIPLIGVVAALAPHKNLFTFIDTCAILKEKGIAKNFVVIGEGDLRKELENHAKKMKLGSSLRFLGFRKDALELIPELDVFLITSKTEGLGTSIIDAMACKVPVVATRAGGIPELVIHGKTGILAEEGDKDALANGVKELLENEKKRAELILAASSHIQSFSMQETAKKTLQIYTEILESSGR